MDTIGTIKKYFTFDKESPWHFYRKVTLWSFVVAVCITVPFLIFELIGTGSAVFLYYGDYNAQQICFYEHAIDMVRSGNFGWDWVTDMGSNFMGSYSYYMLGSPFFWMMCIFPSSWAPYLMGPMYIIKYMVAAILGYAYLQRFVKNKNFAIIGALLYSFSGFQIYNTFFNQFHDVVAFFPLLLIGMEELVQNDRRGLFAIAVALNAVINYFMFAGQVAFCVIYFLARLSCKSFKIDLNKFIWLVIEAVLGFMMAWFMFLPGAAALMGNDRISSSYIDTFTKALEYFKEGKTDTGLKQLRKLFVWDKDSNFYWQRYGQIFESYFFPPDIPSRVNFFYGHETRWASISMYLPMFSLSGVFAFFTVKKRTWLKALMIILVICSFVPVLNSMFFLFNSSYYARWLYMMVLMFALATTIALEDMRTNWKIPTAIMTVFCTCIAAPIGLIWHENSKDKLQFGAPPFRWRFWIYVGIAFAGIILTAYIIRKYRGTKLFDRVLLIGVCSMTVIYSCIHITNGKQHSESSDFMVNQIIEGEVILPDPNEEFYRIDQYKSSSPSISTLDNLGIYWNYPTIECFHTVVPPSIMEFYPHIDIKRSVGSRAESKYYGLRAFTSVKYSFIQTNENKKKKNGEQIKAHDTYGFEYLESQNGFDIYENQYFIPMGFAYTEFMTVTDFEAKYNAADRHIMLCSYLVVPDDMADYYSQFMTRISGDDAKEAKKETYVQSVSDRNTMCCDEFNYSSDGFDAKITLDKPSIVYFSVPYEENGWTATVNGKETDVLKVTFGFVAVECQAGENQIVFDYSTPGFMVSSKLTIGEETTFNMPGGLWLSLGAAFIFALYMLYFKLIKKHKAETKFFSFDFYDDCGADIDAENDVNQNNGSKTKAKKKKSKSIFDWIKAW